MTATYSSYQPAAAASINMSLLPPPIPRTISFRGLVKGDHHQQQRRPAPKQRGLFNHSSSNNHHTKDNTKNHSESHHPTGMGEFCSNHMLVNFERLRYGRAPLKRSVRLDELARRHAEHMARNQVIQSSVNSIGELQAKLGAMLVGENTLRGESIKAMHREIMHSQEVVPTRFRCNLLASSFSQFGMGTARGDDGKLYLVQLFSGDSVPEIV